MRPTVRLGRLAGIPVGIHWTVFIIVLLLTQSLATADLPMMVPGAGAATYWAAAASIAVVFFASLLAHELAHAVVAKHYGLRVRRITLWLLGGVSELDDEPPDARVDLHVALAGPATSMVLAIATTGAAIAVSLLGAPQIVSVGFLWLSVMNAMLAGFNMLPGAPLDGGRVVRAMIWRRRGDRIAAQHFASRAGVWLGALLAIAGLGQTLIAGDLAGLWLVLVGWFLTTAALGEDAEGQLQRVLGHMRVGDVMRPITEFGWTGQTIDEFVADVARMSLARSFPVLGADGRFAGVVTLSGLRRLPVGERSTRRLGEHGVIGRPIAYFEPDIPLVRAAALLTSPEAMAAVMADGRLVGVLTASEVAHAIDLAALRPAAHSTKEVRDA